ncbi:hypothetical protein [Paraburkholderia sp. RL17-373-BIF-A]|uniref:hypothetical protein n=1 Tax=Paraburkholderia sp. RL17-373-BIF-A TaxID=3031629 RepID=UPI0038BD2479
MNATNTNELPAHVVAAISSAASVASRVLKRDYGVSVTKDRLEAQGVAIARHESALSGRHPHPDHAAFLKDAMVEALTEHYVDAARSAPTSVRLLARAEERTLLDRVRH